MLRSPTVTGISELEFCAAVDLGSLVGEACVLDSEMAAGLAFAGALVAGAVGAFEGAGVGCADEAHPAITIATITRPIKHTITRR